MDIRQLRYFVQIVESGSLTKASRQLYVAQPALSQQLAKLEDSVGKPLLQRSSRGVVPTDHGAALYHHAIFLLRQFDQTLSIARSDAGAVQGMVSVGLPATTVAALGQSLVRRVRERYPKILLNVVEGMSGHIGQLIRSGQLDVAVLFTNNIAPDLQVEPLLEEELFLIIPEKSDLVAPGRTTIAIGEAANFPLILPTSMHGLRQRIANEFESRGVALNVVVEIDSLTLLMNCVHDGMGATIKPMGAVMQEGIRGRQCRAISFSDVEFRRRNYLYTLPTGRLTTAASLVAQELKAAARELLVDENWTGFNALPTPRAKKLSAEAAHQPAA